MTKLQESLEGEPVIWEPIFIESALRRTNGKMNPKRRWYVWARGINVDTDTPSHHRVWSALECDERNAAK